MTFGMDVRNKQGGLVYTSADVTWNQVDMLYCPGGGTVRASYEALRNRETLAVQMMIDPPPLTRKAIAHTVNISGTDVAVLGGSENAYILVLMR